MNNINLSKIKDMTLVDWRGNIGGSSNGILSKAVVQKGNRKLYLKLGSYNISHGFYGIEPAMELIFSRIGKLLGLNILEYGLLRAKIIKDNREYITDVSVSYDFKENKTAISVETFYKTFRQENESVLDTLKRFDLTIDIYRMFLFDYIICNRDRHGKNLEILTEGKEYKVAPLFDNSLSVFGIRTNEEIQAGKTEINELMRVNNFIGTQNLYNNLSLIDQTIRIRCLRTEDRAKVFQGLGKSISRGRRDYIWETVNGRINNAKKLHFVQWY